MKKFFTLIAMALVAVGVNAQTVINLAGLQTSDFTYDENQYVESTWTDSQDPSNTASAFTKKGTNKLEALTSAAVEKVGEENFKEIITLYETCQNDLDEKATEKLDKIIMEKCGGIQKKYGDFLEIFYYFNC